MKSIQKFLILALMFIALSSFVHALEDKSELDVIIDTNSSSDTNSILVNGVYDDDGSISFVEVCILKLAGRVETIPNTEAICFTFTKVIEGQVLFSARELEDIVQLQGQIEEKGGPLSLQARATNLVTNIEDGGSTGPGPLPGVVAAYYSYLDNDGPITGAKFNVFLTALDIAPAPSNIEEEIQIGTQYIVEKSLTPVLLDNGSYRIDVEVVLADDVTAENGVEMTYAIDGVSFEPINLEEQSGNSWTTSLTFSDPIIFSAWVIIDPHVTHYLERFEDRFFANILPNIESGCEQITYSLDVVKPVPLSFIENVWVEKISKIRMRQDESIPTQFNIEEIDDNPDDWNVDLFTIFVLQNKQKIFEYDFENIPQHGSTPTPINIADYPEGWFIEPPYEIPPGAEIYYNFMDTGTVANMRILKPLNPEDVLDDPEEDIESRSYFIDHVDMEIYPVDEDCSSFNLRFIVQTNPNSNIERVSARWGFESTSLSGSTTILSPTQPPELKEVVEESDLVVFFDNGDDTWEGEIGPFSGEFDFFSKFYAESGSGENSSWGMGGWFGHTGGEAPAETGAGAGEELLGSVVLPDLLFIEEDVPTFVVSGDPILPSVTVKNAGISNTEEFEVGFYLNEELLQLVPVEGLEVNETIPIDFEIYSSHKYLGLNDLKIEIDTSNKVPELTKQNNVIEQQLAVGFKTFNIILNFSDTDILGDDRVFRAFDREFGLPAEGVQTVITFPSGKTQGLSTGEDGTNQFKLSEAGIYFLTASKERFESFEAAFSVEKINLLNLAQRYNLGDTVRFSVETEGGQKVADAAVEVVDPNNQITVVKLNEQAQGEFLTKTGGTHKIRVSRKGIQIFEGTFLAGGFIESIFVAGGIEELLFGSIVRNTPLFILMLLFSLAAAAIAFFRSKLLFGTGTKSTRQMQLENVVKLFIAIVFFLLPFQVANYFGFNAGLAVVIIEVLLTFVFEHYKKRFAKGRPLIRV